jgi:hypothetical protein
VSRCLQVIGAITRGTSIVPPKVANLLPPGVGDIGAVMRGIEAIRWLTTGKVVSAHRNTTLKTLSTRKATHVIIRSGQ